MLNSAEIINVLGPVPKWLKLYSGDSKNFMSLYATVPNRQAIDFNNAFALKYSGIHPLAYSASIFFLFGIPLYIMSDMLSCMALLVFSSIIILAMVFVLFYFRDARVLIFSEEYLCVGKMNIFFGYSWMLIPNDRLYHAELCYVTSSAPHAHNDRWWSVILFEVVDHDSDMGFYVSKIPYGTSEMVIVGPSVKYDERKMHANEYDLLSKVDITSQDVIAYTLDVISMWNKKREKRTKFVTHAMVDLKASSDTFLSCD